jgi:hypothetical protein
MKNPLMNTKISKTIPAGGARAYKLDVKKYEKGPAGTPHLVDLNMPPAMKVSGQGTNGIKTVILRKPY